MSIFREIDYTEKSVRSTAIDTNNGEYLWIAYYKDTSDICALKKVSAHDPSQKYFEVDISVEDVPVMLVYSSYVFLGVSDDTHFIYRYSVYNPLATPTKVAIPSGIIEAPIDLVYGDSYLWWLFPGSSSGENAKIVKTSTAGVFQETIDLTSIENAKTLTNDGTDLWVGTDTDPAELWRVNEVSAGWDHTRKI